MYPQVSQKNSYTEVVQSAQIEHLKGQIETLLAATSQGKGKKGSGKRQGRSLTLRMLNKKQSKSSDRLAANSDLCSRSGSSPPYTCRPAYDSILSGKQREGTVDELHFVEESLGQVESLSRQVAIYSQENERLRAVIEAQAAVAEDGAISIEKRAGREGFREGVLWLGRETQTVMDRVGATVRQEDFPCGVVLLYPAPCRL